MAGEYTIKYADDQGGLNPLKPRFVINPNEINGPGNPNDNTALQLPGRFTVNYGELTAQNLVQVMENFSSDIAPINPTSGLLWFDSSAGVSGEGILYIRNTLNTGWVEITTGGGASGGAWGGNDGFVHSSNFAAVAGGNYFIDTTGGPVTATLPPSPSVGNVIGFVDVIGTWNINSMFADGGVENIMGNPSPMENDVQWNTFSLTYSPVPARGWIIVN